MNLTNRIFVLDGKDQLYRIARTRYSAMLDSPKTHPIPHFATLRIRASEAIIELIERRPARVVRMVFFILEFDKRGVLKVDSLMQRTAAALEAGFALHNHAQGTILDAQSRFVARGGRWKPSAALQGQLCDAALGRIRSPYL